MCRLQISQVRAAMASSNFFKAGHQILRNLNTRAVELKTIKHHLRGKYQRNELNNLLINSQMINKRDFSSRIPLLKPVQTESNYIKLKDMVNRDQQPFHIGSNLSIKDGNNDVKRKEERIFPTQLAIPC